MKPISRIRHRIPHNKIELDISLNSRNLIITGTNGAGKTTFVQELHRKLVARLLEDQDGQIYRHEQTLHNLKARLAHLENAPHSELELVQVREHIQNEEQWLTAARHGPEIELLETLEFRKLLIVGNGMVEYFEAFRQSHIAAAQGTDNTAYHPNELQGDQAQHIGSKLEKHLVKLRTRRSFAITEAQAPELVRAIDTWFASFEEHLRLLFEDKTVALRFDPQEFKFEITHANREPYSFQTLSSGYSAVFSILSRLLMRAEILGITPSDLSGVAIIDEIDAHLHASLQRKILPFLTNLCPRVQFIVTTHSPFVIASVSDALIVDISSNQQIEDLSSYSYEGILQTLLQTPTTSDLLRQRIQSLADALAQPATNIKRLKMLIASINANDLVLDEESAFYVTSAKLQVLKATRREADGV